MKIEIWKTRFKYIFFYSSLGSIGNTEILLDEKIISIEQIRDIEKNISEKIKDNITLTNFQYIGKIRKWK